MLHPTIENKKMGAVYVKVRLSNAVDLENARRGLTTINEVRSCEVEALVDTGCTRSVVSQEVAERLGLTIKGHKTGTLADGRQARVGLSSPIDFVIMGRDTEEQAYVMGDEVLIGQTTLETTDLLVDCNERRLRGKHPEGPIFRL